MVRHGQTDANAARICSGGTEATLTPDGEAQAASLGALLEQARPRPSLIIHSGRTRTIGTAQRLNARLGLQMDCDTGLDEHNFGDWIGQPTHPHVEMAFSGAPVPGGEDMETFSARIRKTITGILGRVDGIPLLAAHGGLFRAFWYLYGRPQQGTGNCVLHYFEPVEAVFPWRVWKFVEDSDILHREAVESGAMPGENV